MEQEKVTRQELREMQVGETRTIQLVDPKKVTSARVTCRQMGLEEGLRFIVKPDYKAKTVVITRTD